MSAAAAGAQAQGPSALLHPPHKPAAAPLLEIRVIGQLLEDAELRFSPATGGKVHASLLLRLEQPLGLPYEAWLYIGTEVAQHSAAAAKQQLLKRGARVAVYARGIRQRTDHGRAVIALENVTDVVALPFDRKATAAEPQESHHAH